MVILIIWDWSWKLNLLVHTCIYIRVLLIQCHAHAAALQLTNNGYHISQHVALAHQVKTSLEKAKKRKQRNNKR